MKEIKAIMAGTIIKLLVGENDTVNSGDNIYILESMKMEVTVRAEESGTVKRIHVNEGDSVKEDDPLFYLEG